jgi:hypothetical protein
MMFTYLFVAVAHFRFPYSNPSLRNPVTNLVAGGAALAMLGVSAAMCFIPARQSEMWASLACLGVILAALVLRNALRGAAPARAAG